MKHRAERRGTFRNAKHDGQEHGSTEAAREGERAITAVRTSRRTSAQGFIRHLVTCSTRGSVGRGRAGVTWTKTDRPPRAASRPGRVRARAFCGDEQEFAVPPCRGKAIKNWSSIEQAFFV